MASLGQISRSAFHSNNFGGSKDTLDAAVGHDMGEPVSQSVFDERAVIRTM